MVQIEERISHDHSGQLFHNNHHTLKKEKQHDVVGQLPWCHCKHQIRHLEITRLQVKRQSEIE